MLEYLDCLMDGLKALGGDRIRMPERRRFDPDDSCMNDFLTKRNISFSFDSN